MARAPLIDESVAMIMITVSCRFKCLNRGRRRIRPKLLMRDRVVSNQI